MEFKNNFEYDLKVGQVKERELADILENKTIEVKSCVDANVNVFVEYESRGKPSGISTSKADYYCFVLKNVLILIDLQKLKTKCKSYYHTDRNVIGGDLNTSKGILLPIRDLK